ncbi:hypothetical protein M3J09_003048 [Ascochyta lentis]
MYVEESLRERNRGLGMGVAGCFLGDEEAGCGV